MQIDRQHAEMIFAANLLISAIINHSNSELNDTTATEKYVNELRSFAEASRDFNKRFDIGHETAVVRKDRNK